MNNRGLHWSPKRFMTTWKKTFSRCAFALATMSAVASAQTNPSPPPGEATSPAPAQPRHPLRQILITKGVEEAKALTPTPGAGFVVLAPSLSFMNTAELTKRLAAGENQIIEDRLLAAIAQ